MYLIRQDGDLSEMADEDYWHNALPPLAVAVYRRLVQPEYAESDRPIADSLLAQQVGASRTALNKALEELERADLACLFIDEPGLTEVTLYAPPPISAADAKIADNDEAEARKQQKKIERKTDDAAADLVTRWKRRFLDHVGMQYGAGHSDTRCAKRILHAHPEVDMIALVDWFWNGFEPEARNRADSRGLPDSRALMDFEANFDAIRQRKKDYDEGWI